MGEIYRDSDVTVSEKSIKIGDTTYPVASIGSVRLEKGKPNLWGMFFIVSGLLMLFPGVGELNAGQYYDGGFTICTCALFFWLGSKRRRRLNRVYIRTASYDQMAYESYEFDRATAIKVAIDQAIDGAT